MKYLWVVLLTAVLLSCEKNDTLGPDSATTDTEIVKKSEAHLQLKSTESVYTDNAGNKYYSLNFNPDTLEHVYSVYFEKGKKYYLTIAGEQAFPVEMHLITSENDTLFYGEITDVPTLKKYIIWESTISDTLYVAVSYTEDINFHTYYFQLTFEELSIKTLLYNGLTWECSGDWFIGHDNQLALACQNTSIVKWARIVDNTLFNYEFSCEVGLKSGTPDIYTGIVFYAADEIQDMYNMPMGGYEFKIMGPTHCNLWTWTEGGYGCQYAECSTRLNQGEGTFNDLSVKTDFDNITLYANSEEVYAFRNVCFMDNGLYLTVWDMKEDTLYFNNIRLIK